MNEATKQPDPGSAFGLIQDLLDLAQGLEDRARQVRSLASTRLNPSEVSRLASKAGAYAHAAELLREALERCEGGA